MQAKPSAIPRARELRRGATGAEAALWRELRGRRLLGFKFRRQVPAGPFFLDFYCAESRLAVELDGGGHAEPQHAAHDTERSQFLARLGIRVLRFWNHEVFEQREAVLEAITDALQLSDPETPHLLSSPANARRLLDALDAAEAGRGKSMTVCELRQRVGLEPPKP